MVESIGLQQVLQLSNMASRAHTAQQGQGAELARSFDKELQKLDDREADKTQPIKETPEDSKVKEEGDQRRKPTARIVMPEKEKEEEAEEKAPPSEAGQGNIINVVA